MSLYRIRSKVPFAMYKFEYTLLSPVRPLVPTEFIRSLCQPHTEPSRLILRAAEDTPPEVLL